MSVDGLILVTGGTGGLGRRVVERLRRAGREVRVASRHAHSTANGIEYVVADLAKDQGVEEALAGSAIVVHCAGVGKIKEDTAQAQNLVRAAERAGVHHLLSISVVGADRIPVKTAVDRSMFAYFASQRAKELVVASSRLPWTNLRATQFHDGFILEMVRGMSKLPVVPIPAGFRFQPIDTDEVADSLVQLALGVPAGQAPDIAGPKIYDADYLFRTYLEAAGKRRALVRLRMPGEAAAAIRSGANLSPSRAVGVRTWEAFLAAEVGSPARRAAVARSSGPP
ncbi:MAG TPA: NAD(P)H-binding protein [Candidatus Dormibacteraeota bacterium]|jgi:uncharacterized protein YbjT (DUF2867 family)